MRVAVPTSVPRLLNQGRGGQRDTDREESRQPPNCESLSMERQVRGSRQEQSQTGADRGQELAEVIHNPSNRDGCDRAFNEGL